MAPHHLFSPSFPPRGYFHPAVLQLVFTFFVSCRTRRSAFLTQPKKPTTITPSFFLSRYLPILARRPVFLACRSLDGISFEPLATQSPFNVTKDPAFSTHITPPSSVLRKRLTTSGRSLTTDLHEFPFTIKVSRMNHVTRSLMIHSQISTIVGVPLPRSGNQDEGRSSFR